MMAKIVFLLALAVVVVDAVTNVGQEELISIPMKKYRSSCGKTVHLSQATMKKRSSHPAFAQIMSKNNPGYPGTGVGLEKMEGEILKDGYFPLTCQKDYLLEFGDKYGPNKHAYKIGDSAGVSIVRYEDWVAKEDLQQMSVAVCFDFCRSVPGMQFFGLFVGRECYCAPYTQMLASDDTATCDAPCPGKTTEMCGGMKKSSIFEMHMCGDTKQELEEFKENAEEVLIASTKQEEISGKVFGEMQGTADTLLEEFGQHGDTAGSNTMQAAKAYAGDMEKIFAAAGEAVQKVKDALTAADSVKDVREKEAEISAGEVALAEAEAAVDAADEQINGIFPSGDGSINGYKPLMYLVDKKHQNDVSTCGGTISGWIVGGSPDECAHACDDRPQHCVGFGFFPSGKDKICALFSKFRDVSYYPECTKKSSSFLQQGPKSVTQCYAKFAALGEKDLAPEGSGKCEQCLKSAVEKEGCLKV